MIPTIERKIIQNRTLGCITTSGKKGKANRIKPYVPIFSRTPARMIEPAVGASTWASGSQVWNGNIGTLMANPARSSKKINTCGLDHDPTSCHLGQGNAGSPSPRVSSGIEKVRTLAGEYR